MNFKSVSPSELAIPELHQYLLGAVAPRPICFAGTVNKEGAPNLAPFSFFNVFSANPPIVVFSPARSGRDGTPKHTYLNVLEVPEVTINVVTYEMVHKMNVAAAPWEAGVSEYDKAGFTPLASEVVKPFRVAESPVQMECVVKEVKELGNGGGSGNLIIAEVVKIHLNEAYLNEDGKLMPEKINQVGRMGGSWYCKTGIENMFQLAQPMKKTLGYDRLPEVLKTADWLSANDLGQLAGLFEEPDAELIAEVAAALNAGDKQQLTQHYLQSKEYAKLLALYC